MKDFFLYVRKRIHEGILHEMLGELKWIYRWSMHYKGAVIWYICLGVFGTGMGLGVGVVSKYIIDAVTGYDSGALLPAVIGYGSMSLFQIGVTAWSGRVSEKIRIMVNQEIRLDVFNKVLMSDWQSLSRFHSGDLLNRLNGDVNTVASSVIGWIPNMVTGLVRFFATLALILYYDPTMAVLALLSAPITLAMSSVVMRKMRFHNQRMLQVSSEVMSFNEEAFQNIPYIKSFGLMKKYDGMFRKKQDYYKDVQLDYNKFSIMTSSLMSVVGMGVSAVCFGWGVYRLWSGAITYGTMTLFIQQAGSLTAAFSTLVNLVPVAINAATSAGRIMDITELPMERPADTEAVEKFRRQAAAGEGVTLRVEHLSFHYQAGKQVLSDVSFHVHPREVIALVGPSGEGKTTILRILLGLVNPQEGHIWAESGSRKLEISSASRELFAYVPQGNTMMSGTIRENLLLLKTDATDEELWEVLEEVCAAEFVKNQPKGLDTYLAERGGGLSEGQLQRLSIARALLCDAPVLLLDEATSALDMDTEHRLLENIMKSTRGKTCIVTTHRPSVLNMCTRVYRVSGQRVAQLSREELQRYVFEL